MNKESADIYQNTDSNLKDFLLTGELGNLGHQPSVNAVRDKLGEPQHLENIPDVVPEQLLTIYHYGNLEIVNLDGEFLKFKIIFQAKDEEFDFAAELGVKWYSLLESMDYKSFKKFISQNHIECREVAFPFPVEETGYTIEITSTKIWLIFDPPPSCKIQSVHYEPSFSACNSESIRSVSGG